MQIRFLGLTVSFQQIVFINYMCKMLSNLNTVNNQIIDLVTVRGAKALLHRNKHLSNSFCEISWSLNLLQILQTLNVIPLINTRYLFVFYYIRSKECTINTKGKLFGKLDP